MWVFAGAALPRAHRPGLRALTAVAGGWRWMRLYRLGGGRWPVEACGAWRVRVTVGYGPRGGVRAGVRVHWWRGQVGVDVGCAARGGFVLVEWYPPRVEASLPVDGRPWRR